MEEVRVSRGLRAVKQRFRHHYYRAVVIQSCAKPPKINRPPSYQHTPILFNRIPALFPTAHMLQPPSRLHARAPPCIAHHQ